MKTKTYKSQGLVYGRFWGGGEGSYPARKLTDETYESLIEQAKKGLDGSLDSGMGFERLLGAVLDITEITTIEVDGEIYKTTRCLPLEFIGELNGEQKEHLEDYLIHC